MSREKQIEEIVNELIFCGNVNKGVIAEHLYVKGYRKQDTFAFERLKDMGDIIKPYVSGLACDQESGSCELTDCRSCNARRLATELYDAGYRKQSEVARGVIEVLEKVTNNHLKAISMLEPQNDYCAGGKKAFDIMLKVLAKLKEKYTEGNNDNR